MVSGLTSRGPGIPVVAVQSDRFRPWLARQSGRLRRWVGASGFDGVPGGICLVAGSDGGLVKVLAGIGETTELWDFARLAERLPAGRYRLEGSVPARRATLAALGWALGSYSFDRYKTARRRTRGPVLLWPGTCDRRQVERAATGTFLVRDLVNTPAGDMGPAALAAAARKIARAHGATCAVTTGAALLARNYPLIHAVGRAAVQAPRLIDLRWGPPKAPRLTLVGKGVCFDSGGLDLKSSSGMLIMKKDMAGGATALALAKMIMMSRLKVRLRVLVPAVENSIAANAYRPMDVLTSRSGRTVEVGNTDAEGRLVLADALTEAVSEKPRLVIDFATLTGAQRVACGYDLPAFFTDDETVAARFEKCGRRAVDPVWRLPLFAPYRRELDSPVADIASTGSLPVGGAITAALFLQSFVGEDVPWLHLDFMGWNRTSRPGRPRGGEAQGLRAAFGLVTEMFGN